MAMQSGFIKRIRDIMRMDAGINGDAQRIEQMVWMLFLKVYDAKEDDWEINEDNYASIIPEECRWRNWAQADSNGHAMTGDTLLDFVNNTLFPTLKELSVTPDTPVKKAIVKSTFEDANNYMKDGVYLRQVIDVIDEIEFDDVKESHAFGFVYEEILKDLQAAGSSGEFYTPRAVTDFMALMIQPKLGERMADFACGTGGFITSWLGQLSKQVTDTEAQKAFDDSIYGIEKKPFPYLLCVTNMLLHDIEMPKIYHENSLKHNLLDYTEDDKFNVILMNPPYGGHEDKSIQGFFPDDLASSETADLFMSVIMYRLKKNGRAAVVVPDGFLFGTRPNDNAKYEIKKKLISEFNLHTVIRLPGSVFAPYTPISTNLLFFDNTKATEETWFYRLDMPSDRKHFSKTKPMELKHFSDAIDWWNNRHEIILEDGPKSQVYSASYLLNELDCNIDLCGYPQTEEIILDPKTTLDNFQDRLTGCCNEIYSASKAMMGVLNNEKIDFTNVNLTNACNHLSVIAKSLPDIMKKSILQCAIQGKLVEQKSTDGNADTLYMQLVNEKASKIKAKEMKKSKPLPPIEDDELLFDIPDTWRWVRLDEVGDWASGATPPKTNNDFYTNGTIPWLRTGDLNNGIVTDIPIMITELALEKCSVRLNPKGSVLIAMYGATIGKVGILDIEATTNQACCACIPFNGIYNKYLSYFLQAMKNNFIGMAEGGAQPNISKEKILKTCMPLPPYDEQIRIVAKIEELLPYCD